MKHMHGSEILKKLMEVTQAIEVKATAEEEEELGRIAEDDLKSEQDRARTKIDLEKRRKEAQLLEQARGAATGDLV